MTDQATGLPEPTQTAPVPIARIERDERVNTRPIDEAWVRARISIFDPHGLGVPLVSRRDDGTYIVLDGQNRIALAKACGHDAEITCQILEGLTLFDEAKMFIMHNDSRAVRPGHRFMARITQEEPVACAILAVAQRTGWEIDVVPGPGVITAVSTLERLWRDDARHHPDDPPFVLENTLLSIVKAWQHAKSAQDSAIISGIGALYVKHGLAIEVDHMAGQLAAYDRGPTELLLNAKGLQRVRGGSTANSVAELVTDEYNKDKPRRRLQRWR